MGAGTLIRGKGSSKEWPSIDELFNVLLLLVEEEEKVVLGVGILPMLVVVVLGVRTEEE